MADVTINSQLDGSGVWTGFTGGFTDMTGALYPHTSAHLQGKTPVGGNVGFKDGYVEWRKFKYMLQRASGGVGFFW